VSVQLKREGTQVLALPQPRTPGSAGAGQGLFGGLFG
jgi:hypothetical protein